MTDDWSLIMDDWWLITDDWWLMIDDWWLMSAEWWLMINDKINTNIIWNVKYRLPQGGSPPGANNMGPISYYIFIYFIINHQSSLITHQSSVINHQLSIINHPWSMINHRSSITSHQFFRHKNTHLPNIKRKSAKRYPRRHEKKGELRKVSKSHQQVKKKERRKLSPEAREKRIAPQSL